MVVPMTSDVSVISSVGGIKWPNGIKWIITKDDIEKEPERQFALQSVPMFVLMIHEL